MQQWRYHSLLLRDLSVSETKLNGEGDKGWELVTVCMIDGTTARAFFKMKAEDSVAATVAAPPSHNPYPE